MGFADGSGISWTICKQSAPRSKHITTPTHHHSIFTGRMLFLTPNQQRQSTESIAVYTERAVKWTEISLTAVQFIRPVPAVIEAVTKPLCRDTIAGVFTHDLVFKACCTITTNTAHLDCSA